MSTVSLLLLVWLALPLAGHADATDDAVRRIASQMNCPICQGESVADSNAQLAADMRSVIRTRVQAGESDQQILSEFAAAYGQSILRDPPKQGFALGVWIGPIVALAAGVIVVGLLVTAWTRGRGGARSSPGDAPYDPRVMDELQRVRQQVG